MIEPDTKDWTWVIARPCPECGFDGSALGHDEVADLSGPTPRNGRAGSTPAGVGVRPRPSVWSPLEYACHLRATHRIFDDRVRLMLGEDDPRFANWDQDATAIEDDYGSQDPAVVTSELVDGGGHGGRHL